MEQPRGWAGGRQMQQTMSCCLRTACPQQDGFPLLKEAEWSFLPSLGRFGKAESHGADPSVINPCSTSTPLPWACSTDLLTPTLPADLHCCETPRAGRDHRNCQLQGGAGRTKAAHQSYTWWDSCGGSHCPPGIGPSESHFLCLQQEPLQRRSGPQGPSSLQPFSILPLPWQYFAAGAACATALGGPWPLAARLPALLAAQWAQPHSSSLPSFLAGGAAAVSW